MKSPMARRCENSDRIFLRRIEEDGFVILEGPLDRDEMARMESDYEANVISDAKREVSIGRTTIRVNNVIGWNQYVKKLYSFEPILRACSQIIDQPFKLSTLHARSVFSHAIEQDLHVDSDIDAEGFPLVGFIYMVDDFTFDNGATRFVLGSHKWSRQAAASRKQSTVAAIGRAGSVIIFNGSVWHGHSANRTEKLRRSIQGAYIRHSMQPAMNFSVNPYKKLITR